MPMTVFFIDDESVLCDCFADEFSDPGITVKTFSDPKLALAEILKNPPDLIFLDYRMPGVTGEELATQMPSEIPKFLVTGELNMKTTFPFTAILKKPFEYEAIRAILDKKKSAA